MLARLADPQQGAGQSDVPDTAQQVPLESMTQTCRDAPGSRVVPLTAYVSGGRCSVSVSTEHVSSMGDRAPHPPERSLKIMA